MNRSIRWTILGLVSLIVAIAIILSIFKRTSVVNPAEKSITDDPRNRTALDGGRSSQLGKVDSGSELTQPTKSNRENHIRELSEPEVQYLSKRRQVLESIQELMKEGLNTRHPSVNSKIKELSQIRAEELSIYLGEPNIEAMGTRSKEILAVIEDELEVLTRLGIEPSESQP